MNYFTCMSAVNCSWQGEQQAGECIEATVEEMNVECGLATKNDDCVDMGCTWVPKKVRGGRRGRRAKEKKAMGTCVAPVEDDSEAASTGGSEEETNADACAGFEHHQTAAAQAEHCQ